MAKTISVADIIAAANEKLDSSNASPLQKSLAQRYINPPACEAFLKVLVGEATLSADKVDGFFEKINAPAITVMLDMLEEAYPNNPVLLLPFQKKDNQWYLGYRDGDDETYVMPLSDAPDVSAYDILRSIQRAADMSEEALKKQASTTKSTAKSLIAYLADALGMDETAQAIQTSKENDTALATKLQNQAALAKKVTKVAGEKSANESFLAKAGHFMADLFYYVFSPPTYFMRQRNKVEFMPLTEQEYKAYQVFRKMLKGGNKASLDNSRLAQVGKGKEVKETFNALKVELQESEASKQKKKSTNRAGELSKQYENERLYGSPEQIKRAEAIMAQLTPDSVKALAEQHTVIMGHTGAFWGQQAKKENAAPGAFQKAISEVYATLEQQNPPVTALFSKVSDSKEASRETASLRSMGFEEDSSKSSSQPNKKL